MKTRKTISTGIMFVLFLVIFIAVIMIDNIRNKPWLLTNKAMEDQTDIYCLFQKTAIEKGNCLSKYAYELNSSVSCMKIKNLEKHDLCLMQLLFLDNKIECSDIEGTSLRSGCVAAVTYGISKAGSLENHKIDFII